MKRRAGPPFPVEPRRDWHKMVVEEERERGQQPRRCASERRTQRCAVPRGVASSRRRAFCSAPQPERREREAEEMRQRAADAAMRHAERLAVGAQECALVEVDATGEQSLADSTSELASDDANEASSGTPMRPARAS